jgi:DNA polymerase-3 subunit gamma/tau
MENFVVSARKYRPGTFATVVGQDHITTTLKNAIKTQKLAQAFLFCGPRGVGKTTCARILAKTINCQHPTEDMEPCNECDSCQSFMKGTSMNIRELDAASNNSVEDIRNLVEQVRYTPQSGKYKIYIIDEVHMLSTAAFNAFLKTLEEPPPYAIFILATTEKHKIIPTILSRCQIFDFNRIQINEIVKHLQYIAEEEGIATENDALHLIAQKADGALRDALSLFDLLVTYSSNRKIEYSQVVENLHILDYDYFIKATDALLLGKHGELLLLLDEILKKGFDGHHFMVGLAEHFRSLLVCQDTQTHVLLQLSEGVKAQYIEQANRCSPSFLLSCINLANECDIHYKSSKNQRLHLEIYLLKMAHISAVLDFAQVAAPEEAVKKK